MLNFYIAKHCSSLQEIRVKIGHLEDVEVALNRASRKRFYGTLEGNDILLLYQIASLSWMKTDGDEIEALLSCIIVVA